MSTPPLLPVRCPKCGGDMPEGASLCSQCHRSGAPARVVTNPRERAAAVAAYLTPLPAVLFLFLRPYSQSVFVRFHAFQSIIIGVVVVALCFLGALFANLGWTVAWLMFGLLFFVGLFFLWLVLSIKAAQGVQFELPVLGAEAARRAGR